MRKKTFMWHFKKANDENVQLLINFKKHLIMRNISEQSIYDYLKDVYRLMIYLQDKGIRTLDAETEDVLGFLDLNKCSDARMIRKISVLNTFYGHNHKKKYCKQNIIEKIDRKKYYKGN